MSRRKTSSRRKKQESARTARPQVAPASESAPATDTNRWPQPVPRAWLLALAAAAMLAWLAFLAFLAMRYGN